MIAMELAESLRVNSDELWTAALGTLGQDLRDQLKLTQKSKLESVNEVLKEAEVARQQLQSKKLAFERKDGRKIYVQDVMERVLKSINRFKEVVDVAVSFDPGHAALPWAAVRYLLTVSTNNIEMRQSIMENIAEVTEFICQSAILDKTLPPSDLSPAQTQLKRSLTKLSANILEYLGRTIAYCNSSSTKRFLHHGILASSDIKDSLSQVEKARLETNESVDVVTMEGVLDVRAQLDGLGTLMSTLTKWGGTIQNLSDNLDESRRDKILDWVSKQRYGDYHQQTYKDVLEGTAQWLLSDKIFTQWNSAPESSLFWLHGMMGAGKSRLTSVVVHESIQAFKRDQAPAPAYFYCSRNPGERDRSDPTTILACLARQIARPRRTGSLLPPMIELYNDRHEDGSLILEEIRDLLLGLLREYEGETVTIIIDALDECDRDSRGDLLTALEFLLEKSTCPLKIFVSSRDDADIMYRFKSQPNIAISKEQNSDDIDLFVRRTTDDYIRNGSLLPDHADKDQVRDRIVTAVAAGAQGMFRWASLSLIILKRCSTFEAVVKRLGTLPEQLDKLYEEILAIIEDDMTHTDRAYAKRALSWLLCAQTQLESKDFLAVVSQHRSSGSLSSNELLALCCNLLVYDSRQDTFRFSHLSVREFLEKQSAYTPLRANGLVAEECLSQTTKETYREPTATAPQLYASTYWPFHVSRAISQSSPELKSAVLDFLDDKHRRVMWHKWFSSPNVPYSHERDQLGSYKVYGDIKLPELGKFDQVGVDLLTKVRHILMLVCTFDWPYLYTSSAWSTMLLEQHKRSGDWRPEEIVITNGSYRVMEWWLDSGVDFEVSERILCDAATSQKHSAAMVKLLLKKRGTQLRVTHRIVMEIAKEAKQADRLLDLLLNSGKCEVESMAELCTAAAENRYRGVESLIVLSKQCNGNLPATQRLVIAAAGNLNQSQQIFAFLASKYPAQLRALITNDLLKEVASTQNASLMAWLLEKRQDHSRITQEIFAAAHLNYFHGKEMVNLLRKEWSTKNELPQEMLTTMMLSPRIYTDDEILSIVQDQGPGFQLTPDHLEAALEMRDHPTITRLLDKRGKDHRIIQDLLLYAARAGFNGLRLMDFFLAESGCEIQLTEDILIAAAYNPECAIQILKLFHSQRKDDTVITTNILKAAAGNRQQGAQLMRFLLEEFQGAAARITEEVLMTAASNREIGPEVMECLMEHPGTIEMITPKVIKAAARGRYETLALLLKSCGHQTEITEDLLVTGASNWFYANEILGFLLNNQPLQGPMPPAALEAAARNLLQALNILRPLLADHGAKVQVTEAIVSGAASNTVMPLQVLKLLLDKHYDGAITENILLSAANNKGQCIPLMEFFLERYGERLQVTGRVIKAAAKHADWAVVRRLIDVNTDFKDSEDFVKVTTSQWRIMTAILESQGRDMIFTEDIIKAAAGNLDSGRQMLETLLDLYPKQSQITAGVLQIATSILDDRRVIKLLLRNGQSMVHISETILQGIVSNEEFGYSIMEALLRSFKDAILPCVTAQVCLEAASCGQTSILDLLRQNLPPDTPDDEKWSDIAALFHAAKTGRIHQVRHLIAQGTPSITINVKGNTPLSAAIDGAHWRIVDLLLRQGNVDVNAVSKSGRSLLVQSCLRLEQVDVEAGLRVITLLIEAGADPFLEDAYGNVPFDVARGLGREDVVQIVEDLWRPAQLEMTRKRTDIPWLAVSGIFIAFVGILIYLFGWIAT